MIENMPEKEIAYDYVSGVSVGSISAAVISLFAPGEEAAAVTMIENLFKGKTTDEMMVWYKPAYISAFFKSSIGS